MSTSVENFVGSLESALEENEFGYFFNLMEEIPGYADFDNNLKELIDRLMRALALEHILRNTEGFEDILEIAQENEIFNVPNDFEIEVVLSKKKHLRIDHRNQVQGYISLTKLDVFEVGNLFLNEFLDLWNVESGYTTSDLESTFSVDPNFISRFRCIINENLERDFFGELETGEFYALSDPDESFYVGGASFTFSNLNIISSEQLATPCKFCGLALMICKSKSCHRRYFYSQTGIDCNLDVVGIENEDSESVETILITVSELGDDYMSLLADRTPTIEGVLLLHKNETDVVVRLLIGSSFFIDYDDYEIANSDEDFEALREATTVIEDGLIADEYLVVSWKTPFEFGEDAAFLFGLYRGNTRAAIEKALKQAK